MRFICTPLYFSKSQCNLEYLGQHPESLKKGTFGIVFPRNNLKLQYFWKKGTFWSNMLQKNKF